jgi:hypothetical protein
MIADRVIRTAGEMNMFRHLLYFLAFIRLPDGEPRIQFAPCETTTFHVAVQRTDTYSYLVHFHLNIQNLAEKRVFARVRCKVSDSPDATIHEATKEITVKTDNDAWAFYLQAPRFSDMDREKVTYQIEFGQVDPSKVDDHKVFDTFAWKFRNDTMFTGTRDEPIRLLVSKRVIVVENGEFVVKSQMETKMTAGTPLRYGIVSRLQGPDDGASTAKRAANR